MFFCFFILDIVSSIHTVAFLKSLFSHNAEQMIIIIFYALNKALGGKKYLHNNEK